MGFYLNGILTLHFILLVREKLQKTIILANKHRGFNCKWSPSESIAVWTFLLSQGPKTSTLSGAVMTASWWFYIAMESMAHLYPFIIYSWWIPGNLFKSFWTSVHGASHGYQKLWTTHGSPASTAWTSPETSRDHEAGPPCWHLTLVGEVQFGFTHLGGDASSHCWLSPLGPWENWMPQNLCRKTWEKWFMVIISHNGNANMIGCLNL